MLVSPHVCIFDILHKDSQQASNWHYPTSYPESHYLKWIADWRSLAPSLNLCPRMGKGQSNTLDWQNLSWREVEIFHYSIQSKPYYWFNQGTIDTRCNIASGISYTLIAQIKERARFAYNMWLYHLFPVRLESQGSLCVGTPLGEGSGEMVGWALRQLRVEVMRK